MVRLFNHWFSSNSVFQFALDAILLFVAFMVVGMWLYPGHFHHANQLLPPALLFATAMIAVNVVLGLYQSEGVRSAMQSLARILLSLVLSMPLAYLIFSSLPDAGVRHDALALTAVVALGAFVLVRSVLNFRESPLLFARRGLVLGTSEEAIAVEQSIRAMGSGMSVVGFYPVRNDGTPQYVSADRVLPREVPLTETVRRYGVDDIIVAVRERRGGVLPLKELLECKQAGIRILDLSSFYESTVGQVRLDSLHASWLIFGEGFRQGIVRTSIKRCFDIAVALVLLLAAAPVMLITALAIMFESGGPILYRQERVGQGGMIFRVIKFRSMRVDAEKDGKPRWATSNDDRVTAVGRAIRRMRIDELPQLFNVLTGTMSLVGPRPERPYFVDKLAQDIPFYAVRHSVKPGVTGWAQVRYHYGASVDDAIQKLQYDLYYVKNHTLFLDIVVLVETIGIVLTGKGAQ